MNPTGLAQVKLVFKLPESLVVDLAFVAQAHGSLPFYPQQIAGQAREVFLMSVALLSAGVDKPYVCTVASVVT